MMEKSQTIVNEDQKKLSPEKEEKQSVLSKVNRDLLIPKMSFFFFFMATGAFLPYLGVYYKQLWLNARESGILLGIRPFIKMLCSPVWGIATDVFQKPKVVLLMSIFGSLIAHWSQSIVSPFDLPCYLENTTTVQVEPGFRVPHNVTVLNESNLERIKAQKQLKMPVSLDRNDGKELVNINVNRAQSQSDNDELQGPHKGLHEDYIGSTGEKNPDSMNGKNLNPPFRSDLYEEDSDNIGMFELPARDFAGTAEEYGSNFRRDTRSEADGNTGARTQVTGEALVEEPRGIMTRNKRKKSPKPKEDFRIRDNRKIFMILLVIVILGELVAAPAPMLTDSVTLALLSGKEHEYGKQRLFGSFGWGVGSLLSGAAVTAFHYCPYSDNINYVPAFYVFAFAMLVNFFVTMFFKFKSTVDHEDPIDKGCLKGLKLFCNVKNAAFIVVLFFLGLSHSLQLSFLFWFLQDIGGTPVLFTLIMLVNSLSEVLMFFVATYFVQRIGHDGVLYLGLGCYGFRFLLYSYIEQPWYVLPVECLQGITYGGVWTASVSYVGASTGNSATVQGIIHGVYWGLGMAVGGVLGGFLVHVIGARMTFRIEAICSLVILVFFFALNNIYVRNHNYTELSTEPDETDNEGSAPAKSTE